MARTTYTSGENTPGFFLSVLKPLFISLCITFGALCLLALFIAYGPVSESAADICILAITIISIFIAGFLAATKTAVRGYLTGGLSGICYVLSAYVVAALAFGSFCPRPDFLRLLALGLVVGAVGGIFGVNMRRQKR